MELFEGVLISCIYLLFPLSVYLIVNAYYKNIDSKTNNILFEISLFSSIYLIFRQKEVISLVYPMTLVNVPLLLAYLKKKNKTAVLMSIVIIIFYHRLFNYLYIYLFVEYVLYYIIYTNVKNKKMSSINLITSFVFIKSIFLSFRIVLKYNFTFEIFMELIFTMSIFIIISYLCFSLFNKVQEILDLNSIINQLEREKTLRNSLFKITHEIKNPIAVCKGYLDMIDYNDAEKIHQYIEIVKDQIKRTLILMDDFLDYTKVKINKEEVDLYMLLEDSCNVSKPLFKKANVRLDFDIKDDEIYMNLDYNRMKQVLVNIFKNSIEAIDKKKKDNYIKLSVTKDKKCITIKIKDNGVGMDKKTLLKVDEMFYTTKEKGTGLGVALSKEIIQLHDGTIKYSSVKNKYTIVCIKLPINA